jgi:hybrid cluster-associated redox disulfide protein
MAESGKHFDLSMTISDAMGVNPRVAEVFAAFHLGGCAHCHISRTETLDQVCSGYGIDPKELMEALEGLVEPAKA